MKLSNASNGVSCYAGESPVCQRWTNSILQRDAKPSVAAAPGDVRRSSMCSPGEHSVVAGRPEAAG
ncbi:hypothetical protein [Paenibacillus illinoisensis]|uniref:hypothetical protein n=1 Tax=Paenibacillus illinoisensis TaxID=59845 RepID=UPI003D2C074A